MQSDEIRVAAGAATPSIHQFGDKLRHPRTIAAFRQFVAGMRHYRATGSTEQLAATLSERLAQQLQGRSITVCEVGAALGAHVGPGLVAVAVAPAPAPHLVDDAAPVDA